MNERNLFNIKGDKCLSAFSIHAFGRKEKIEGKPTATN
jgi:hypothetical protein